jgi:uncharacterized membrane protein YbhN (UPF0104 family)
VLGTGMKPAGEAKQKPRHRAGWLLFALKALLSLALLGWVLVRAGAGTVLDRLGQIDGFWAAVSVAILVVQYAIMVARWDLVLRRAFGLHIGLRRLSLVFGFGEIMGSFLPGFVGLDAIRTLALAKIAPTATVLRSVLVDRAFGLAALLLVIAATLPVTTGIPALGPAVPILALVSLGGLAALAILIAGADRWGVLPYLGQLIAPVARDLRATLRDPPVAGAVIATGLIMHLLSVALIWSLGRMFGVDLGLANCLLIVPSALLISALPISVGGWGLREGAIVSGFALLGIDTAAAGAASIGFGLSIVLAGTIGITVPWLLERARKL